MKIMIVGGGGREHAIAWAVAKSPKCEKLYAAPGNAGIAELAECVNISGMDAPALVAFAKENQIDYAVVAWEGDYRYRDGEFRHHQFRGEKWQSVHDAMRQRYLKNGYRVLLTRARQGYVIYVPKGSEYDPTRPPSYYDETYWYLLSAGIRELPV